MVKIDLIVIGNIGSGKTSLVNYYVKGISSFTHNHLPTLGANLEKKTITHKDYKINICIWDTAGQEKYFSLTKGYFQKADGILLIFDLTDHESFKRAEEYWLKQAQDYMQGFAKICLVGNKADLVEQRQVKYIDAVEVSQKYGLKYIETSARTGENVEECFNSLAHACADCIKSEISQQEFVCLSNQKKSKSCLEKFKEQIGSLFFSDSYQKNNCN